MKTRYILTEAEVVKVSSKKLLPEEEAKRLVEALGEEDTVLRAVNGFFYMPKDIRIDWHNYAPVRDQDWYADAFDTEEYVDPRTYRHSSWKTFKVCTIRAEHEEYTVVAKEPNTYYVNLHWSIAKAEDVEFVGKEERKVY